jgi:hypothetical protein
MDNTIKLTQSTTKSEIDAPVNEATMQSIKERYEEEKTKRLRDDGNAQYIDASKSAQFEQFGADPWVDPVSIEPISTKFPDNHPHRNTHRRSRMGRNPIRSPNDQIGHSGPEYSNHRSGWWIRGNLVLESIPRADV